MVTAYRILLTHQHQDARFVDASTSWGFDPWNVATTIRFESDWNVEMARTVQFSEYGGTDVLAAVDAPALTAGPGQVRIEVRAAGINPIDWKIMRGFMREMIPLTLSAGLGSDVAGVVDQVG